MKLTWLQIIIGLILGSFAINAQANQGLNQLEPAQDNVWTISYKSRDSIYVSVNGLITHGDRLNIRLVKKHCDQGNFITSVYTMQKNPKILELKGNNLPIKFLTKPVEARVVSVNEFLAGYRLTFDLGWMPISSIKTLFGYFDKTELSFINTGTFDPEKYFDIKSNAWSTNGAVGAINRAVAICDSSEL